MAKRVFSLLGVAALMSVFLTEPCMVECVRADGQRFMEIIGRDPCNISHGSTHYLGARGAGAEMIAGLSKSENPCSDRFSQNPRFTRQSFYRSVSLKLFLVECDTARFVEVIDKNKDPVFKEPPLQTAASSNKLNLRI